MLLFLMKKAENLQIITRVGIEQIFDDIIDVSDTFWIEPHAAELL